VSFTSLLIDSVTVFNLVEGAGDRYGDPTETFGAGVVVSGRLEQTEQREFLNDRDTRVSDFRLFLPAATVITATSEVVIEGDRFRVNGDPAVVQDSAGPHHLEVMLERIEAG
jgi:hypothetical protein